MGEPTVDELLAQVEEGAAAYLRALRGVGENRRNLKDLRDAVDRAEVTVSAEFAPRAADVREGERVEDDPIWIVNWAG